MKMRTKPKNHYAVYCVRDGDGVYASSRDFIGDTWAVSAAQACNNVRYRYRDNNQPHGGYSFQVIGDILDEGSVIYTYEAELID